MDVTHRALPLWKRCQLSKCASTVTTLCLIAALAAFTVPYRHLAKRVDDRLAAGPLHRAMSYYGAPETLSVGDTMAPAEVASLLKQAGIPVSATDSSVFVQSHEPVEIQFGKGQVTAITNLTSKTSFVQYQMPPRVITNISDEGRAKRVMIRYSDLPPVLVQAIVSAEDKRFFQHSGLDTLRIAKAFYVDVRQHRKEQGASTITMQLARSLCLDRDKLWGRKVAETFITLHLERKLNKEQILEDYSNLVYLGGQGSFGINGFGEAARAYFSKDIHALTLTEAATLAGLIQRPSSFNPFSHPERALDRRNIVLTLMRENKAITTAQYDEAVQAPLGLHPSATAMSEGQYFLDLAGNEAMHELDDRSPAGSTSVYTTIDMRLQRAAEEAIASGMLSVDKAVGSQKSGHRPQVALIALDPHTGEIKALVGGRDYAASQLNRILAKRPPGSVFKPFVYTAALNTAIVGGNQVLTQASTVMDSPTTFQFENATYTPNNFKGEFMGNVTLRQALAHSLNNAAVKVGQMVGFDRVVALAHAAGMNEDIKATPAVALGAYQVTPLEIAGAYTIFANGGERVQPAFVSSIRDQSGTELYRHSPATTHVLDPRVAFLMVDMLQEVMRSGTAAGVRSRGFKLPAAGKTGTSHDGWFAGFTSQLLCVVWVGYDDYSDLHLEGARSALPIWTDFMIRAARFKQYGDAKPFVPPAGVVQASATSDCPAPPGYFIAGTQPVVDCTPQEVEVNFTAAGATQRTVESQPDSQPPQATPPPQPTELPKPKLLILPPILHPE
jgi:penicillin-binding protein 1B